MEHHEPRAVAERLAALGYPTDAKLVILNGDDLGMSHAANAATFDAMEHGLMTAASLMMPCPWAYDACRYIADRPHLDVGVHLTLTSEWETYRWGPLLGAERCPSLVDAAGFFPPGPEGALYERGTVEEIEAEAEAQIRRALDWGLAPTNLDGHMGTFYSHARYLEIYVALARRYDLPLRMAPRHTYAARRATALYDALSLQGLMVPDDLRFVALENVGLLKGQLVETLRTIRPGVTEVIAHVALGTPEARAIMSDWPARVEAHRLLRLDVEIRDEITRQGLVVIGWRELRDAQRRGRPLAT